MSTAVSHKATSANSSPGSGGHCDGRALGKEGNSGNSVWMLHSLKRPPPSFLSLTDSTMHSHAQPPKRMSSRPFIHSSFTFALSHDSTTFIHSLGHPFIPTFTSSLLHLLVFHSCTRSFNEPSEPVQQAPSHSQILEKSLAGSQPFTI